MSDIPQIPAMTQQVAQSGLIPISNVNPLSSGGTKDCQPINNLQTGASVGAVMGDKCTIFRRISTGLYYQWNSAFLDIPDYEPVVVDKTQVQEMVVM